MLQAGDLELDVNRHLLYRQGEVVHLTPTEFELLALLMRNQGDSGYARETVALHLGTGIWH